MVSHILVPLAPPFLPKTALMMAAVLSVEQSAHVTLLYVNDKPGFLARAMAAAAERKQLKRFLGDAAAVVSEYGSRPLTKIARGTPAYRVIKSIAKQIGADAIVLGAQRDAMAGALSSDMTTKALLSETDVPVFVVHESRLEHSAQVATELA
jgi:nucleotide-binding universal stress UspA family protein